MVGTPLLPMAIMSNMLMTVSISLILSTQSSTHYCDAFAIPTPTRVTLAGVVASSPSMLIHALSSSAVVLPQRRSSRSPSTTMISSTANDNSSSESTTESTTTASTINNDSQWWNDVVFKHGDLPTSVVPDFPILSTIISSSFSDDEPTTTTTNGNPLIYFDSAATSQKPTAVTTALTSYYHTSNSNVHRGAHSLSRAATEQYEAARDTIASFINAPSRNEIVFTSGATEALNLIAATYGRANIQKGDEILITELEHHSNIVPWQILAEQTGATLKYIPLDVAKGCLDLDTLPSLLTPNTKIVALQHVSNVMGCITPLEPITPLIRALAHPTVKIILDACQSIPHMPLDVQALGVDFVAASGHKMCGPTGIGFLWGREEVLNSMPPYMGGGEMIDEVRMGGSTFAVSPARFEAGTPSIAQAIGLGAAISYLTQIGMSRIEEYEREIGSYLLRRMKEIPGLTVLGPQSVKERGTAIVAFVCEGVHPSDLGTFLDMEGIAVRAGHHCCQPLHSAMGVSHSARASLYFYNTKEEVDIFIIKLEETLAMLGGGGSGGDTTDDEFVPFF